MMTALTFHQGLVTPSDKNCSWWWRSFHSVPNLTKANISPFLWIYTNKILKKKHGICCISLMSSNTYSPIFIYIPPLKLANQYLEPSHTVKYLGLVIDSFLSWHDHIDYISSKISKSINIITKLKRHSNSSISCKCILGTCTSSFNIQLHNIG